MFTNALLQQCNNNNDSRENIMSMVENKGDST